MDKLNLPEFIEGYGPVIPYTEVFNPDRVKARAQAVTATNQEDGVAQAIETYVLA